MSAPEYVPNSSTTITSYSSPPRRPEPWLARRPGDLGGEGQPQGERLGRPGPDQGYVYRLLPALRERVRLHDAESWDDVSVGAATIALKRASGYGRAPIIHDLTVAFSLWGFLQPDPPEELVKIRRKWFAGVANPHHYAQRRALADAVPDSTLLRPHTELLAEVANWRSLLDLGATGH